MGNRDSSVGIQIRLQAVRSLTWTHLALNRVSAESSFLGDKAAGTCSSPTTYYRVFIFLLD